MSLNSKVWIKKKQFIAKFEEIWDEDQKTNKKKVINLKALRTFVISGVKPQKQMVFVAKSTKKQFLLSNSRR